MTEISRKSLTILREKAAKSFEYGNSKEACYAETHFPSIVRKKLFTVVDDHIARKHEFLSDPERDFTRHRKLSLDHMIKATMLLGSGSIDKEMLEYSDYQPDTVTASAFTQQRDKLSNSIFKSILYQFTHSFSNFETLNGYRLVAVDGSK